MTSLPIFLRPSVKITEIDLTQRIAVLFSTIGSIVGEFERGPVVPTYQSGILEDFKALYGSVARPDISFAWDTATTFMTQSGNLLINRKTRNAKYARLSVLKDTTNNRVVIVNPTGSSTPADQNAASKFVLFSFGALVASNILSVDIVNGASTVNVSTTYATSAAQTAEAFRAALQVALNTIAPGNSVTIYPDTVANTIVVELSKAISVDFEDFEITGGTPPAFAMDETPLLFDVYAENPGSWANDYAIKLSNIDFGQRERHRLTFGGPLVTANSVSVTINGTSPITQVYTTSSDNTLALLATALSNHPDVASATVEQVAGGTANDRSILVVAKLPGKGKLQFSNLGVTLGASQTSLISEQILTGIEKDDSFTLELFHRDNLNLAAERPFVVSLKRQLNSLGYQQNIEHVVNRASTKSINIRIKQSVESLAGTVDMYGSDGLPLTLPTTAFFLSGGDLGTACTSAEIRQGWLELTDRVQYPMNVMLNAGYTAKSVQKEMAALAEKRFDCIAILDAPSDKQGAQELRDYRVNELDIDTSYAAMYSPDVEIEDISTGERRFIPPSGPIGATYGYSDRLTNQIGAPAGLNRGKITLAMALRHRYTEAQEELLFPVGINCIIDRKLTGPTVMGEETLQVKKTVLSSVHARRILNLIKTGLVDGLDYTLFDPNTDWTRSQAVQLGHTLLKPMTKGDGTGGLYDYRIKCDKDNNTPEVIDADVLAYDVYLKIVRVIKGVAVRAVLTRTGASFEEIIDAID